MRLPISCMSLLLALSPSALFADDAAQRAKDALIVRTLMGVPGIDLRSKPDAKAALLRHLETIRGSEQYLELVEKFKLRETRDELLRLTLEHSESTLGVKASSLLVKF